MGNTEDLVAALNNHQVTDDEGNVQQNDTVEEESTTPEQTTVEETTTAEKPAESPEPVTQTADDETKTELVVDEAGKRYVPAGRFDHVWGEKKAAERRAEQAEQMLETVLKGGGSNPQPVSQPTQDRTAWLETELLYSTLPQFNPNSDQHDAVLDQMGGEIYIASKDVNGNPTITKLEAGRRAIERAKQLAGTISKVQAEARTVKSLQSDQGITNRVTSRDATKVDTDKMGPKEFEAYLKETGQWL